MNPLVRPKLWARGGALFVIAFAFTNVVLLGQVTAVDPNDTFYVDPSDTFVGLEAFNPTSLGVWDSAFGYYALHSDTTGSDNTAIGAYALWRNTIGSTNTATGIQALYNNDSGDNNTATGAFALDNNTIGHSNTATGLFALGQNRTGYYNTANGVYALSRNTTGIDNTASGVYALYSNTFGLNNTATGFNALYSNTTGTWNTADGVNALYSNTTGYSNVAIGGNAGKSLTTGVGNVCIGMNVLGVAGESNTTRIRNVYSSAASGRAVYVNSDNKIGTLMSSRRFKDDIRAIDRSSEAIFALKPVTFRYKKEIEPNGAIMFGLIAEEVEKVAPDLVTHDAKGEVETVRYDAVNAMLLNEFLKEHRKNEQQEATITHLEKQVEALTAGLQKVSAQLELSKAALQTVLNNH